MSFFHPKHTCDICIPADAMVWQNAPQSTWMIAEKSYARCVNPRSCGMHCPRTSTTNTQPCKGSPARASLSLYLQTLCTSMQASTHISEHVTLHRHKQAHASSIAKKHTYAITCACETDVQHPKVSKCKNVYVCTHSLQNYSA